MTTLSPIVTVPVDGVLWSFNYEWAVASSAHTLKTEAMAEASLPSVNADVVLLREDNSHPQFALGALEPRDRQRGMAAAIAFAGALAAQTIQSGIGLFRLPNGMVWLVQVVEDQIAPDGDRIFKDFDDAIEAFTKALGTQRDWPRIYAPPERIRSAREQLRRARAQGTTASFLDQVLAREGHETLEQRASPTTLSALLDGRSAPRHKPRTGRAGGIDSYLPSTRLLTLAGGGAAALVLLYVFVLPLVIPAPPPPIPAPVRQAAAPPPPPVINTPVPSIGAPRPSGLLVACFDAMAFVDDHLPSWGWTATTYSCSENSLFARLTRAKDGQLEVAERAYAGTTVKLAFDQPNYDSATLSVPLAVASVRRGAELERTETIRRRLISFGWATGETIVLQPFVAPPARDKADQAAWLQAPFTITTATEPTAWGPILDDYPGLVVTELSTDPSKMTANPTDFSWTIKGFLYAHL